MYYPQTQETSALGSIRTSAPSICCYAFSGLAAISTVASPVSNCLNEWGTSSSAPAVHYESISETFGSLEITRSAISELRFISGFTLDQIASIFGVSRRTVHNWANGKPMTQAHEQKLFAVLDVVRRTDTGSSSANRSAFIQIAETGQSPLEMLTNSNFEGAIREIGVMVTPRPQTKPISEASWTDRTRDLQPPLGALHESVHNDLAPAKRADKKKFGKNRQ